MTDINPIYRLARLQVITNQLDAGTIEFWSGVRPAPGGIGAGAVQASTSLSSTAGTITGLTFTFGAMGDALRIDSQTIVWARIKNASGVWVMDVDVGLSSAPSSPPEQVLLASVTGAIGAFLHISTGTITG